MISIVSEASARGSAATSGCTETDAWRGRGVVLFCFGERERQRQRERERESCLGDHQDPQK